ncbi:MAG: 1-phosphofructokinase family hexose kinase [bacterium]
MITAVALNPAVDVTLIFEDFRVGEVNRARRSLISPGGKGINVAKAVHSLGHRTVALGFLGRENSSFLRDSLKGLGIATDFVEVKGRTRTNYFINERTTGRETVINTDSEFDFLYDDENDLRARVKRYAGESDFMIFSGSVPSGLPKGIYADLIEIARGEGCRTVLDADDEPLKLGLKAKPFIVKPNLRELERALDVKIDSREEAVDGMRRLIDGGIEVVILTMGGEGSIVASQRGIWFVHPQKVKVVSPLGAGDAYVAGFCVASANREPFEECIRWGAAAATASLAYYGAAQCPKEDVERLLPSIRMESIGT